MRNVRVNRNADNASTARTLLFRRSTVHLLLVAAAVLVPLSLRAATPKLPIDQLRLLQLNHAPNLLIIDVRDPNAFNQSHIQGAKNIPAPTITQADLPRDGRIVVYCGEVSCPLSDGAAVALTHAGYSNVSLLDGGLAAWSAKHYPVQTSNALPHKPHRDHTHISDARAKLDAGTIIALDVRPPLEFKAGHLHKAINVPLEQLDKNIGTLPKDIGILVYDREADRSRQAYDKLKAAGLTVTELSGGLAGWAKRKQPIEVK